MGPYSYDRHWSTYNKQESDETPEERAVRYVELNKVLYWNNIVGLIAIGIIVGGSAVLKVLVHFHLL